MLETLILVYYWVKKGYKSNKTKNITLKTLNYIKLKVWFLSFTFLNQVCFVYLGEIFYSLSGIHCQRSANNKLEHCHFAEEIIKN